MSKEITLSKQLRALMNARGNLSEMELSDATGIPQATLNHILNEKTTKPQRKCLTKLADFFGISVQQLLEDPSISTASISSAHTIPIIQWDNIQKFIENPLIASLGTTLCDISVSSKAFALRMNDFSMSPLFPEKTILIFDPDKKISDRSYGLFSLHKQGVIFRQAIFDGSNVMIKALNPELNDLIRHIEKNDKLIAALVMAKMEFL